MIHPVSDARHMMLWLQNIKVSTTKENDIVIAENDGMSHKTIKR